MNNYKKAFTLAETLLTIGIIGVIAAMVIPTTISKIQRLRVESGLSVAYKNIESIIKAAELEEGPMEEWNNLDKESPQVAGSTDTFVRTYLAPHVKGGEYKKVSLAEYGYKDGIRLTNGKYLIPKDYTGAYPIIRLPNGMILFFSRSRISMYFPEEKKSITTPYLGYQVNVDINGLDKPNTIGKDIFTLIFYSNNGRLFADGQYTLARKATSTETQAYFDSGNYEFIEMSQESINAQCLATGGWCSAAIMRNGWKIPKNYPWL